MKKEINQILIVIGFIVVLVGLILAPITSVVPSIDGGEVIIPAQINLSSIAIVSLLGATFIFAKNSIVKNIGYGLCAIDAGVALNALFNGYNIGLMIYAFGYFIMLIGALLYFLVVVLKFFGFVKDKKTDSTISETTNLLDALNKYRTLVEETILSEEEFNDIKANLFASTSNKAKSIDDLKKWKKAVEQNVITEEEYASIKSGILNK